MKSHEYTDPNATSENGMYAYVDSRTPEQQKEDERLFCEAEVTTTNMKTRNELIEEIMGEFDKKFRNGATSTKRNDEIASFLCSALIKISDASMEAVEVEEQSLPKTKCINAENHLFGSCFQCEKIKGFNSARTASQEKREAWIK